MGDAALILGSLFGSAIIFTVIILIEIKNTEATPRPDLVLEKKKGAKR